MLKVVADTNVLVSSLIRGGKPRQLVSKIDGVGIRLVSSEPLLKELLSVLARDKIRRYVAPQDVEGFLRYLGKRTTLVKIKSGFKVIKEDPMDDATLNTAYSAKADYIISGDKHLTSLREFKGIRVVTADEMLKILR